jgi:hypothetical protein
MSTFSVVSFVVIEGISPSIMSLCSDLLSPEFVTSLMFATLAGGFLPYILKFVLFKQPEPVTVDPDNLSFKSKSKQKIEEYTQNWQIADIRIDSKRACIKGEQDASYQKPLRSTKQTRKQRTGNTSLL